MSSYIQNQFGDKLNKQQASQAASTVLSYAGSLLGNIAAKGQTYVQDKQLTAASLYTSSNAEQANLERDLDRLYHARVRPLLDAVDQLRTILSDTSIKLPTIVVVGDQSSGKSSVLEALSGVNLPRGSNITTRVPLVLRLVNSTSTDSSSSLSASTTLTPTATISAPGHKEERISNLNDIAGHITRLTNSLAGSGVGVVNTPISLTVYRPNSPDLTLVDLPGITRNPIGNQPATIYNDIIQMIKFYIEPVESIILNVMPVTIDFATAECVQLAKQYDAQGQRTIAVVTKCDLAEYGIKNKLYTAVEQLGFNLGLVAVKNRNQVDNDTGMSWEAARQAEHEFFVKHQEFSSFLQTNNQSIASPASSSKPQSKMLTNSTSSHNRIMVSTTALAALLTTVQEQHVRLILPKKRLELRDMLSQTRQQLQSLPVGIHSAVDARMRFDQMLTSFCTHISAICNGDHSSIATLLHNNASNMIVSSTSSIAHQSTEHLHINPRIHEQYRKYQSSLTDLSAEFLTAKFAMKVEKEISENMGVTLPNFLSHQVFHGLVHSELLRIRAPTYQLIDAVRQQHASMLSTLTRCIFGAFPALSQTMSGQLAEYLEMKYSAVMERVEELMAMEDDIFTVNTYYMDTVNKLKQAIADKSSYISVGSNSSSHQSKNRSASPTQQQQPSNHQKASGLFGGWINDTTAAMSNMALSKSAVCVRVNDLTISFDSNDYTLPALNNGSASSAYSNTNSSAVLDMQVACLVYTALVHKRVADQLALLLRYHFTRAMSNSGATVIHNPHSHNKAGQNNLYGTLQHHWVRVSDSEMMEYFKEASDLREKRDALIHTVEKLEKAAKVFDSI